MAKRTTAGRKPQKAAADPHARVRQLYQALAQGQAPAVEREVRRHLRKHPADVVMLRVLGASLFLQGRSAEAVDPLRRSLKIDPNHAQSWDRLGISLDARGEHDEAAQAYAKALALDPSQPTSWTNAAQNAQQRGDYDEAERLAREGLQRAPEEPELLLALARALHWQKRYPEALNAVHEARRVQPDNAVALELEAKVLADLDRIPESLERRRGLVKRQPKKASYRDKLISELIRENRIDEAVHWLEEPRTGKVLSPGRHLFLTGRIAEARGQNHEALRAYAEAIEHDPVDNDPVRRYVMLSHVEPDAPVSVRLRAQAEDAERKVEYRAKDAYLLGKIHWDAGEYDTAMDWLARGNALFREHVGSTQALDRDGPFCAAGQVLSSFSAERLRAGEPAICDDTRPVFVLGMPRSGKTLIESILAGHSEVAAAGESNDLMALFRELMDDWGDIRLDPAAVRARLEAAPRESLERLCAEYLERLARFGPDTTHIVQTLPFYLPLVGALHMLLPNARFIFCRRDPEDLGLSCYAKDFVSHYLVYAADLYETGREIRACEQLMAHWQAALPEGTALTIDYETLVREPDETAAQLFRHIGLEPVPFADDDDAHAGSTSFALTAHTPGRPRTDFIGIAEPVRAYLEPLRRGYEDGPGW